MTLSSSQYKAIAIMPMISGTLSIIGSVTVIIRILRSKLSTTLRRLVFAMSVMDVIYSLSYIASTLPSPGSTPFLWKSLGNTTTCSIQGLMFFAGSMGTTMYNCLLSLFYMLTVAFGVKDPLMTHRIEPWFHIIPLVYIISTSSFLLVKKSFNPEGSICMIASYPMYCSTDPTLECARGINAERNVWTFQLYPILAMGLVIFASMSYMYFSVWRQEKIMDRYRMIHTSRSTVSSNNLDDSLHSIRSRASSARNTRANDTSSSTMPSIRPASRKRQAALRQCTYYVSAYLLVWIFGILQRLIGPTCYPLWFLAHLVCPLQGFFNSAVYLRPQVQYTRTLESNRTLTFWQALVLTIQREDIDMTTAPRRNSMQSTGRHFTAREMHLQAMARQVVDEEEGATTTTFTNTTD